MDDFYFRNEFFIPELFFILGLHVSFDWRDEEKNITPPLSACETVG
jgi:hypothetical protein